MGCCIALCNGSGYIKGAITGPEFIQIRITVIAGTDDIDILLSGTCGKPARTGWIPIAPFIGEEPPHQSFCELHLRVQEISCPLTLFFQLMIALINFRW